jgi:hypothetical protein
MANFTKATLRHILLGLSKVMFVVGGLSFLFGDRALMEFGKVDFVLAEFIGIGFAAFCMIIGLIAHHKAEDLEWQEANEEALKESSSLQGSPKP